MELRVGPCGGRYFSSYNKTSNTILLCPDERIGSRGRGLRIPVDFVLAHEMGHAALGHGSRTVERVLAYEIAAHAWALRQRGKVTPYEARCILATKLMHTPTSILWQAASVGDRQRALALRNALVACVRSRRVTQVV